MIRNFIICAVFAVVFIAAPPLYAAMPVQGFGFISPNSNSPISIEADNGIEWSRKDNLYTARGNARAQSGDMTVTADELRGYYRGGDAANGDNLSPGGKFELYKLEAVGHVTIQSGSSVLTADSAFYDLDQSVFVAQGKSIELQSDKAKLTASERIEYWQGKNMAVARGRAVAIQQNNRLTADTITAFFRADKANSNGKLSIDRIDAAGSVKIQSGENLATSDRASYDLGSGQATLKDNVKLTQGPNQLNGDYAEMNTQTGISRILSNKDNNQGMKRVRALVIPEAAKKPATIN